MEKVKCFDILKSHHSVAYTTYAQTFLALFEWVSKVVLYSIALMYAKLFVSE